MKELSLNYSVNYFSFNYIFELLVIDPFISKVTVLFYYFMEANEDRLFLTDFGFHLTHCTNKTK